jgi:hypothetical protein
MKTTHVIPLIISIFFSQIYFSQSLLIKGFFKNNQEETIQASYMLIANNEVVCSGDEKKIKIELELNNDYILIVSKKGYVTKSVTFSTHTSDKEQFCFEFDMYLKEEPEKCNTISIVSTNVFYDSKSRAFNYTISKKQYSQH